MKDFRKGRLGGNARKTTVEISKTQTQRTKDAISRDLVRDVPGSGNGEQKGDKVVAGAILCEEKATTGSSIRLTKSIIEKICKEAMEAGGKIPVLLASFVAEDTWPAHVYRDWAILPLKHVDWIDLVKRRSDVL